MAIHSIGLQSAGAMIMLTKTQKPKTKQELIRVLQSAPIKSVEVYEGADLALLPSANALSRSGSSLIVIR